MSTHINDNHPIITLDNYEEYFLMYVDDELTPQERSMVEAFVKFHPELQTELDLLLDTKLQPGPVSFTGKESLIAERMGENSIDEALLLHVDGELNGAAQEAVVVKLAIDPAYRLQYRLLLRTKSDPEEVVPCPNKEALYRHTVYRMHFGAALRTVAAVLLVACLGLLYLRQKTDPPQTAVRMPETSQDATNAGKPGNQAAKARESSIGSKGNIIAQAAPVQTVHQAVRKKVASEFKTSGNRQVKGVQTSEPLQENNDFMALGSLSVPRNSGADLHTLNPTKNDWEPDVTSPNLQPYIATEAAPEPAFAADTKEGRGRGNIKSLLRKATRMVERRTGLSATNEEEELVIGVVALKLK